MDASDTECDLAARDGTKITPGNLATKSLDKKCIWALHQSKVKAPLAHRLVMELWLSDMLTTDNSKEARAKGATTSDIACYCAMQEGSQFEMNENDDRYWEAIHCANESTRG